MGARDAIAKAMMGIKAYHSSPHTFDRFDLSKIGTGEGAQVYGHGLYFAENPAVSGQGGQYWQQFLRRFPEDEREIAERLQAHAFDRNATAGTIQRQIDELQGRIAPGGVFDRPTTVDAKARTQNYIDQLLAERDRIAGGAPVGPRTYEVNIKADPVRFLDWDKPLAQQGVLDALSGSRRKSVQELLNRQDWQAPTRELYGRDLGPYTGQDFYKALSYDMTGKPGSAQASDALRAGGVPGIKYLDEGSRSHAAQLRLLEDRIAQGNTLDVPLPVWQKKLDEMKATPQTSNYVVFNPDIVDIKKMYGFAGAPGAAAAIGSTFDPSQYEASQ
jgi:hypothetical protein